MYISFGGEDLRAMEMKNSLLKRHVGGAYNVSGLLSFVSGNGLPILSPSHFVNPLRWHHNERDSVSNYQPDDCLLNRLFRRRSKKTPKLCVTGLCAGNSPGTFPAQLASNAENLFIGWRHHGVMAFCQKKRTGNNFSDIIIKKIKHFHTNVVCKMSRPLGVNC